MAISTPVEACQKQIIWHVSYQVHQFLDNLHGHPNILYHFLHHFQTTSPIFSEKSPNNLDAQPQGQGASQCLPAGNFRCVSRPPWSWRAAGPRGRREVRLCRGQGWPCGWPPGGIKNGLGMKDWVPELKTFMTCIYGLFWRNTHFMIEYPWLYSFLDVLCWFLLVRFSESTSPPSANPSLGRWSWAGSHWYFRCRHPPPVLRLASSVPETIRDAQLQVEWPYKSHLLFASLGFLHAFLSHPTKAHMVWTACFWTPDISSLTNNKHPKHPKLSGHHGSSPLLSSVVDVHRPPAPGGLTVQEARVLPGSYEQKMSCVWSCYGVLNLHNSYFCRGFDHYD